MNSVIGSRQGCSRRRFQLFCALALAFGCSSASSQIAAGAEPQWIWSPAYEKELAPTGYCYLRKSFDLGTPEQGEIQVAADDNYQIWINGQQVGSGKNWKVLDTFDITKHLVKGRNSIAVKAENSEGGSAAVVARVLIKQQGDTHIAYSTDETWKTSLKEFPGWQKPKFDDSRWLAARAFGALGATLPWGNEVVVGGDLGQFKLLPEFRVEWVIEAKETGSLIAMTFDEFGQIIASREKGGLVIVRDDNKDGLLDTVDTLCDDVKNCQGLLCLSGRIFVIGDGPQGAGLYRLSDEDQNGKIDRVESILKFTGEMGEHGPHALRLGPDGLIYIVCGNFSHPTREAESSSPYRNYYEGDLVTPRYEDARGHAVGIKAPGGSVLRTDTTGSVVELVAGGLQNPYDIAFTREGELLTADSDMEWDSGLSWYRPTRVNHLIAGSEFGWRSGWAKWPDYYIDSLPPLVETGRGSPTGLEVYNHFMFPARYHNALFVGDWSRGRILAVKLKPNGASYRTTTEVFCEGKPLNITDLAVGPDGWLYFCTGGRDTEGGIHRIVWEGTVPKEIKDLGKGITRALKQPQIQSAWARQQVALLKQTLGDRWDKEIRSAVIDTKSPAAHRVRAMELMQIFGPYPEAGLLISASRDSDATVRAKAAAMMGIHSTETTRERLVQLLGDDNANVKRVSCESLARAGQQAPPDLLLVLTTSEDRYLAWSARRMLERIPVEKWKTSVLKAEHPRVFMQGSIAMLNAGAKGGAIDEILARAEDLMGTFLSDEDFVDLLRVMQLALMHGHRTGEEFSQLRQRLADEYPSQDVKINRELVRLLTYMQDPGAAEVFVKRIGEENDSIDKLHLALHARFLTRGWTIPLKLELLKFYEDARNMTGGHSFAGYIENVSRDFFAGFNDEERLIVLTEGDKWPSSALSVLAKMPPDAGPDILEKIIALDRKVRNLDSEPAKRLRIGITAVLGGSGDADAMAYLRELYEAEPDRRVTIAMGLAQQPDGENWPYLVRSLSVVEGTAAQEVMVKLAQVDHTPEKSESYRQVILRGLMLGDAGGARAVTLLEKWTGKKHSMPNDTPMVALQGWQQWFTETYPNEPPATLPVESEKNNWTYQELLSYLTAAPTAGATSQRGAIVFEKAQCIKCHRFGDRGETVGPDLTTVAQRFQKKEILESILFPSQVISDQYASQTVLTTNGKTISGMVSPGSGESIVILQSSGEKVTLAKSDIDQMQHSKVSAMPEGLLNPLSLDEILALFAYLSKSPVATELTEKPAAKSDVAPRSTSKPSTSNKPSKVLKR